MRARLQLLLVITLLGCGANDTRDASTIPDADATVAPDGAPADAVVDSTGIADGSRADAVADGGGADREFVFTSDWRFGTGDSDSALLDGGSWDDFACAAPLIRIVNADATLTGLPAHWPENLMEVDIDGSACRNVVKTGTWETPAVGESLHFRVLVYNNSEGSGMPELHNVQSNAGNIAWTMLENAASGGTFTGGFKSYLLGGGEPFHVPNIPAGRPLRYEWTVHRESETTVDFFAYIYDAIDNTLIAGPDDMRNERRGNVSLTEFAATSSFDYAPIDDTLMFKSMIIGQQGPVFGPTITGVYYYGGYAVCRGAPCGPYSADEAVAR